MAKCDIPDGRSPWVTSPPGFLHPKIKNDTDCAFGQIPRKGLIGINRRTVVAFCSAALMMRSLTIKAQPSTHTRTVGVLMGIADDEEAHARAKLIEQGLAKKGWIIGQNLHIEYTDSLATMPRAYSILPKSSSHFVRMSSLPTVRQSLRHCAK